jgi:hypothetical protein
MKTLFALLLALMFATSSFAQKIIDPAFNKQGQYLVKKLYTYDTLVILCDTAFLVNKPMFGIYSVLYNKQTNIQNILNETSQLYAQHELEQNQECEKLHGEYLQLQTALNAYTTRSHNQMDSLEHSLIKAEGYLVTVKEENETLQKQVEKSLRRSNSNKFIYGLGGISIGLIIAFLIK